jgi:hypothetical protein
VRGLSRALTEPMAGPGAMTDLKCKQQISSGRIVTEAKNRNAELKPHQGVSILPIAIKYYAHSQSSGGKKRKLNVSIEESDDRMEMRAIYLSTGWLEAGSAMGVMEALHNWTSIRLVSGFY